MTSAKRAGCVRATAGESACTVAGRGVPDFAPAALLHLRVKAGWSQEQLALHARTHLARVGKGHISLYEQGKRRPQLRTVLALAGALDVSVTDLLVQGRTVSLAALRQRVGLAQRAVAAHLGVAQARWSRIERGRAQLEGVQLSAAAELLGVSVEELRQVLEATLPTRTGR